MTLFAWTRATYRLVTPLTPWYATVGKQTRLGLPTGGKSEVDPPENELVEHSLSDVE